MKHILSVTDCGINSEPAKEEPNRVSLIREIYDFLNYHVCLFAFTWRLWFGTQLKTEFLSSQNRGTSILALQRASLQICLRIQ